MLKKNKIYPLVINKLQNHLGLDLIYFFKGGFFITLAQVAGSLSGILISFAFARFASKELFGKYNLILSILAINSLFSLPGFNTAVMQSTLKGFEKALIQSLPYRLKTSFLGVISLFIWGLFYIFYYHQLDIGYTLILISPLFPFLYSFAAYPVYLQAKKLFSQSAKFLALASLLTSTSLVLILLVYKNIISIILTYVITQAFLHFLFFQKTAKLVHKKAKKDPHLKEFGIFITLTKTLSWVASNLDKIILANLLGYEQLAIYSIANIAPQAIAKNLKSFMILPSVKILPQDIKANIKAIKVHFKKLFFMGLGVTFLGWFFLPYFINILYTLAYQKSIFYSQLLMLGFIFAPFNLLLKNIIIYQKKREDTVFLSFYPAIPKIIFYLLLIPKIKILGAILVRLSESVLLFIYFYYRLLANKNKSIIK